jgi:tetratricopeptide (TPR) repeat protein
MRAKLLLLLCVILVPSSLPAQEILEQTIFTSVLLNAPDPQKRLAGEIAAAEAELARKEVSAGARSPETANAVSALADLYLKAGDYERASPLIERALEIRRTNFGDEHRDTAASLHQLAQFREELGAFAEAETLYRSALRVRIRARHLGSSAEKTRRAAAVYSRTRPLAAMSASQSACTSASTSAGSDTVRSTSSRTSCACRWRSR